MSQPDSRVCPVCGSFLFKTDEVCPTCGSKVKDNTVEVPSQSQNFPKYKEHWFFFAVAFFFGLFSAEEFFRDSDEVVWGASEGSSYGFPILMMALAVISVGVGVFFLVRNKKKTSRAYSTGNNTSVD